MADFQLRVTAETQDAERKLRDVDTQANAATKKRVVEVDANTSAASSKLEGLNAKFKEISKGVNLNGLTGILDINKNIENLSSTASTAANNIKTFYNYAKYAPNVGDKLKTIEDTINGARKAAVAAKEVNAIAGDNGRILQESYGVAAKATETLLDKTAKLGFALFGVQQAIGLLKTAFGSFYTETIGREVSFRETVLKTQTALASTSKVFRNGKEITDPYEKIVSLTGAINERIDSIRKRSIELAGVTSNDVVEVFGMVAQQISKVGGSLKDAEDLAISFSAALGTFGVPIYQARQEVSSIFMGTIDPNSYIATALGITNEDIAKAKTQVGGVVKFLQDRLSAAVAGQRVAAQGLRGVTSNIKDLYELISQSFGAGLLEPLLGQLSRVFEFLFKIKDSLFAIASNAGKGIGSLLGNTTTLLGGGSALFKQAGAQAQPFTEGVAKNIESVFNTIQGKISTIIGPLRKIFEEVAKSIGLAVTGLTKLALSFAMLKIEQYSALISAFANLAPVITFAANAFKSFLEGNAKFLQSPFVQAIAQLKVEFDLLGKVGVFNLLQIGLGLKAFIANWSAIRTAAASAGRSVIGVVLEINTAFAALVRTLARVATTFLTLTESFTGANTALRAQLTAIKAQTAALEGFTGGTGRLKQAMEGLAETVGGKLKNAIVGFIKASAELLILELIITTVVDAVGRYQRTLDDIKTTQRANQALRELTTKYKDVTDASSTAAKAARDYNRAIVESEYSRTLSRIEEIRQRLNDLRYENQDGIQTWGEFWRALDPGTFLDRLQGRPSSQVEAGRLIAEQIRLRDYQRRVEAAKDQQQARDNITLQADNRKNLEKEIADMRRSIESDLFQQRQALASKEVEIFRAAGELRIFQMERANKKMLEGQEGASQAALTALNEYLSTRERGELDIEASKKQLTIEIANLQKAADDYRFDIEKKIFDLRKRSGENDVASAQARNQLLGQTLTGPVPADLVGRQDKAMSFFTSRGLSEMSAAALVGGMTQESGMRSNAYNPKSGAEGVFQWVDRAPQMIAYGAKNDFNKQLEFAWKELQTSESKALQMLRNAKTLNEALLGAAQFERFDGYQSLGAGTEWGNRVAYTKDILSRGGRRTAPSTAATPGATPQLQGRNDIPDPAAAAKNYKAALESVGSAMERLRALQAALTDAKTKAAFEEIAKAAFPRAQVEQYKDQLLEAQLNLKAFAASKADAYDPERTAIEVRYQKELLIMTRERQEIINKAAEAEGIKAAELNALAKKMSDQIAKRKKDLEDIRNIEAQTLSITRAQAAIENLRKTFTDSNKVIAAQKADLVVSTKMQLQGFSPEAVDTQMKLIAAARKYNEDVTQINKDIAATTDTKTLDELRTKLEEVRTEYNKNIKAIQDFATVQQAAKSALAWQTDNRWSAAWGGMKQGLEDYAASLGTLKSQMQDFTKNTLGAMSNAFVELLTTGTTNFRQLASNILADLTRIIFQTMVLKPLLKAIGGPLTSAFGFANGGIMTSAGPLPLRSYAGGGIANSPQMALFGEGSKPEAYVPLPDGKSIPVSFDRSNAQGSGNVSVNVNVDAKGTQAQGNSTKSEQIGRVIANAVQEEILRMKRPGGLLAS